MPLSRKTPTDAEIAKYVEKAANGCYFFLPFELLDGVFGNCFSELSTNAQNQLEMDRVLALAKWPTFSGMLNGNDFTARLLQPPTLTQFRDYLLDKDQKAQQAEQLSWERSFAGYLSARPDFVSELAAFFVKWRADISFGGLNHTCGFQKRPKNNATEFTDAYDTFCERWCLLGLDGALVPRVPGHLPARSVPNAGKVHSFGGTGFFSAVLPLPSGPEIRSMVNQDLVPARPHLKDWFEIVDPSNQGKKALAPYERMFLVHHFWRVLFSRYRDDLKNRVTSLHEVFANFLRPSYGIPTGEDRVRIDLTEIAKGRGNTYWYMQDTPFEQV